MLQTYGSSCGVRLRELLPEATFLGDADPRVSSCTSDSRRVRPGDLFVALTGSRCDGHDFVAEAAERGASGLLVERIVPGYGLPLCLVEDTREAYGRLCHALTGDPSRALKVVGITGTNGKTTTSRLLASVLSAGGYRCGAMGTLGLDDSLEQGASKHTTPPPCVASTWLARMAANDCTHAVMEVSSHALSQRRVSGIRFEAACVTNFGHDHLDYHGTFENYHRAKARLLSLVTESGFAALNADDETCRRLTRRADLPVITYGLSQPATVTATTLERERSEQTFLLHAGRDTAVVRTRMVGDHHVRNCLAAASLGLMFGVELPAIVRGLEAVQSVPGRLERIECGQPFGVFVDYAHTPDALQTVLQALRGITGGRLICVLGAGGQRDRDKRPKMGEIAERLADVAVVTSDNPRGEDPEAIAYDILAGFQRPREAALVLDRRTAIHLALEHAQEGDTVLIAGKGHEDYQLIGNRRLPLDDRALAREWLYREAASREAFGVAQ